MNIKTLLTLRTIRKELTWCYQPPPLRDVVVSQGTSSCLSQRPRSRRSSTYHCFRDGNGSISGCRCCYCCCHWNENLVVFECLHNQIL